MGGGAELEGTVTGRAGSEAGKLLRWEEQVTGPPESERPPRNADRGPGPHQCGSPSGVVGNHAMRGPGCKAFSCLSPAVSFHELLNLSGPHFIPMENTFNDTYFRGLL